MRQIIIAHYNEHLGWVSKLADPYVVYSRTLSGSCIFIPHNLGREAYVFAKYISDNYDNLPDRCVFVHGCGTSWHHSGSLVGLIQTLDWNLDYCSLNNNTCHASFHSTASWNEWGYKTNWGYIGDQWESMFGNYLPKPTFELVSTGSAQFLVSKSRILMYPKSFYEGIENWLLTTNIDRQCWTTESNRPFQEGFISARLLEFTWEYMFCPERYIKRASP